MRFASFLVKSTITPTTICRYELPFRSVIWNFTQLFAKSHTDNTPIVYPCLIEIKYSVTCRFVVVITFALVIIIWSALYLEVAVSILKNLTCDKKISEVVTFFFHQNPSGIRWMERLIFEIEFNASNFVEELENLTRL